jgi:hypothetical protein
MNKTLRIISAILFFLAPVLALAGPLTTQGFVPPNYIGGLNTSNDATTPNSVLDITAGDASDSTNTVLIQSGAITKSTAGAWAAGSGSNGMGNGLTIASNTIYDVCLAYNGGTPDIWFDTSNRSTTYSQCANKPNGITGTQFRRIWTFITDASAHIIPYFQNGDDCTWKLGGASGGVTVVTPGTTLTNGSAVTQSLNAGSVKAVPTGFSVKAWVVANFGNTSSGSIMNFYSGLIPALTAGAAGLPSVRSQNGTSTASATAEIYTDANGNIGLFTPNSSSTYGVGVWGYTDTRGK